MTYDMVAKLITRYGNIRDTDNPLYISYPTTNITADDLGIGGRAYVVPAWLGTLPAYWEQTEEHPNEGVWLTVANGNNVAAVQHNGQWVPAVTWSLVGEDDSAYASFPDEYSSRLLISNLYYGKKITIRVTVQTSATTLTLDKELGLWNRLPEVGDFAWTDGTFDKQDDQSKLLAGVVVMREPLEYDEENNVTKARLWVVGCGEPSVPTSNFGGQGSSDDIPVYTVYSSRLDASNAWGISNGEDVRALQFDDTKNNNIYTEEILAIVQAYLNGKTIGGQTYSLSTNIFDTPVPNMGSGPTINPSSYQDETNNSPFTGYKDNNGASRVSNSAIGDGTGYKQRASTEHTSDFSTLYYNRVLLELADAFIAALVQGLNIDMDNLPDGVDQQTGIPKTMQGYADMTLLIQRYIAAKYQTTDPSNPVSPSEADLTVRDGKNRSLATYRELMFPATRLCAVWCPADIANSGITEDVLHEQYKRGKWKLPSGGLLARIFNFLWNSSCTIDASTGARSRSNGAAVKLANANENVAHEALLPLFSNVLARSNSRRSIPFTANQTYVTSIENAAAWIEIVSFDTGSSGGVHKSGGPTSHVRPVCPFIFDVAES